MLARHYANRPPYEEIFFIEFAVDPQTHVWLRYTLTDLPGQRHIATWALVIPREGEIRAERQEWPLRELEHGGVWAGPGGVLTSQQATGQANGIEWDLELTAGSVEMCPVPDAIEPLLRLGRSYCSEAPNLEVNGIVRVDGREIVVSEAMGVLGHLSGRRSRVFQWAWTHCNHFVEADAVFEALCAQIGQTPWVTPLLTGMNLHLDGHTWRFDQVSTLVRTEASIYADAFCFHARHGPAELFGEVTLAGPVAEVAYTTGRPVGCLNAPFSSCRLTLIDHERKIEKDLHSDRATLELGGRQRRVDPLLSG